MLTNSLQAVAGGEAPAPRARLHALPADRDGGDGLLHPALPLLRPRAPLQPETHQDQAPALRVTL